MARLALGSFRPATWPDRGAGARPDPRLGWPSPRGLGLHLTNPNPILFFTSLYAVGLPEGTGPAGLASVAALIAVQSTTIFVLYALLFSTPRAAAAYARLRRLIEAAFAAVFGAAGIGLLTSRAS